MLTFCALVGLLLLVVLLVIFCIYGAGKTGDPFFILVALIATVAAIVLSMELLKVARQIDGLPAVTEKQQ